MLTDTERAALVDSIAKRMNSFHKHVGFGDPGVTRWEAESYVAEIEESLTTRAEPEPDADAVYELATKIATAWGHTDAFDDKGPAFDSNVSIGIRRRAFKAAEIALQAAAVEPDADAVERVAKALADHAAVEGENWYVDDDGTEHFPKWDDLPDEESYLGGDQEWPNPGRNHFRAKARAAIAAVPTVQSAAGDDLDAMLDSVNPRAIIRSVWALRGGGWEARISVPEGPDDDGWYDYTGNQSVGTGPTRMAAIRDAVDEAKEQEGGER